MKKPLHLFVLLCVLGAAIAYLLHDTSTVSQPGVTVKLEVAGKTPRRIGGAGGGPDQAFSDFQKRMEKYEEKLREGGAKVVANSTPKTERLKLEGIMRFREPRCRELFSKWGLGDDKVDAVLTIIQEREADLMAKRQGFLVQGIAGASEFKMEQKISQSLAEVQLAQLLGDERSEELRKLERQLDADYLASAQRNATD